MTKSRGVAKRYTREEMATTLTLVAYHDGNADRAYDAVVRELGDRAPTVGTLYAWVRRHADIYERCKTNLDSDVELLRRNRQVVRDATEFELAGMARLHAEVDTMEIKDLTTAMRNVAVQKGIAQEKVINPIVGRPSVIVEHREPTKLLEEMARIAGMIQQPAPVVDAEAVEAVEDAEVVT